MITFRLKVIPNAAKHRFSLASDGTIVCYLTAQPEKGKANKELVERLANALHLAQRQVQILQGDTTCYKKILIEAPLTIEDIYNGLGFSLQKTI